MTLDLKALLTMLDSVLKPLAATTATKLDDAVVSLVETLLAYPSLLAWLQTLIAGGATQVTAEHLATAPAEGRAKIGDGKFLELLQKVLPLILQLAPLFIK